MTNLVLSFFTSLPQSCFSSITSPLTYKPPFLPWFIHATWLQTLTWHLYSLLSSCLCVILSLSLYYSLYLFVRLLLSLSNWYAISWSSDSAVSFCLSASYTELGGNVCCLAVSSPCISFKCMCSVSFNSIRKQNLTTKRENLTRKLKEWELVEVRRWKARKGREEA